MQHNNKETLGKAKLHAGCYCAECCHQAIYVECHSAECHLAYRRGAKNQFAFSIETQLNVVTSLEGWHHQPLTSDFSFSFHF